MSSYKKRKYASVGGEAVKIYKGTPVRSYGPSRRDAPLSNIQKQQVVKLIANKTEVKYFDTNVGASNVSTAGTFYNLSDITQGASDITRIGDTALPKTLQIRHIIVGADVPANVMRMIIFRWMMNTASDVPGVDEILEVGSSGQYTLAAYSFHNRDRFNVLLDKTWVTNPNAAAENNVQHHTEFMKMAKKPIKYQAGTVDGQFKILMLIISDSSAITHPTIQFTSRLTYTDS